MARIERMSLHWQIVEGLKEYIIENDLRPGSRLPAENELIQEFGVSRTALREALRVLEGRGILQSRQGGGIFVAEYSVDSIVSELEYSLVFDRSDLKEVYEIRKKLETSFFLEAVACITEAQLAKLEETVRAMRSVTDQKQLQKTDEAFHFIIYEGLNNRLLLQLDGLFWRILPPERELSLESFAQRHEQMLDAIRSGNVQRAYALQKDHYHMTL